MAIGLSIRTKITFGARFYGHADIELGVMAVSVIAATSLLFQIIGPAYEMSIYRTMDLC